MQTNRPEKQLPSPYPQWLEDAIFYQIYPQSFYDANGDGIGDLPGITAKLPYLEALGITAVWINPCFESPFQDAGYDVSDYYQVAARYGSNADLKTLFAAARKHGIRVLLDLVPGHTSIAHPWFQASAKARPNEYSDCYIWTDSAWNWDVPGYRLVSGFAERDGSYMVNFFYAQPALNYGFAAPDPAQPWQQPVTAPGPRRTRQELKNIMRFWLELGASGFRVDMAGSLVKADPDHREIKRLWQEVRAWLNEAYPEAVLVSEWSNPIVAIEAGFHMDFLLPFGTPGWTALLRKPFGPGPARDPYAASFFDRSGRGNIQEFLDDYLKHYMATRKYGLIAFPTGNHDVSPRLSIDRQPEDLKLVYTMLLSMPGVPFIYYGDEIGMRTVDDLVSKEGAYDRTGVRTPMQWDASTNAGFSNAPAGALYLPLDPDPHRPDVASQAADPASLLNHIRTLVSLRKSHPALHASADFEVLAAAPGKVPFVYLRSAGGERILVAINPADQPAQTDLPELKTQGWTVLSGAVHTLQKTGLGWALSMDPVSWAVIRLD